MQDARAIGEGGERFYAQVDTCFLSCHRQGARRHISTRVTDITAVRFPTDGDRLGRALQGTRPANGNPTDLREDQEAVVECGPIAELFVGKRMPACTRL